MNKKALSIKEISELINCPSSGNQEVLITGLCPLDEQKENCISFINASNQTEVEKILSEATCGAVIINDKIKIDCGAINKKIALFHSTTPFFSFLKLTAIFAPKSRMAHGIASTAKIGERTKISDNVHIGEYVVIGDDCEIETGTVIHPHVVIYNQVKIGKNCLIHSNASLREGITLDENCVIQNGAVIGAEGFGYLPDASGEIQTIPQVGTVILKKSVEIGANSCVDRGTIGSTVIGRNTKLDNQVQVGHNVKIGTNTLLCGQVGVGGSSLIGNNTILSGQVGVVDHVVVGDKIRVAAKSGIMQSITEAGDYGGHPVMKAITWKRQLSFLNNLLEMRVKLLKILKK